MRFAALLVALLAVCLAATAQYRDRDTNGVPKTSVTAPAPGARIDINRASVDELLKVPGTRPSTLSKSIVVVISLIFFPVWC
jgi:DNA uptake protein ComE-like DNA-binding protein